MPGPNLDVVFVCTGNICRSPMGEVLLRDALIDAHLADKVRVRSCGIGGWHIGQPADSRAVAELAAAGHDGSAHRAAQLGSAHDGTDLFIALDAGHVRDLRRAGIDPQRIRLARSFDPAAPAGAEVADPYYGSAADFTQVREQLEAALPGMVEWVRQQLG